MIGWSNLQSAWHGIKNKATDIGNTIYSAGNKIYQGYKDVTGILGMDDLRDAWDNISGKTAQEQYKETRKDALNQYNEQFNYLKEQNDLAMQRADSAYQRATTDMRKAGLNPLNGVNGADTGVSGGTVGEMTGTPTMQGNSLSSILGLISPILGTITSMNNAQMSANHQSAMLEETNRHNKEMERIAEENGKTSGKVGEAQAENIKEDTRGKKHENDYNIHNNIGNNTPSEVASANIVATQVKDLAKGVANASEAMEKGQKEQEAQDFKDAKKYFIEKFQWGDQKQKEKEFLDYWEAWTADGSNLQSLFGTWENYIDTLVSQKKERNAKRQTWR